MRGATPSRRSVCWLVQYFYSHAPCGARHDYVDTDGVINQISTHTPLARRDGIGAIYLGRTGYFYSHASCEARPLPTNGRLQTHRFLLTRLLRGATATAPSEISGINISTHTPHAGRDPDNQMATTWQPDFYSHASCEARLLGVETNITNWQFLLTRLLRGATFAILIAKMPNVISTHTPHAGRDFISAAMRCGINISTHTPHAGRDMTPEKKYLWNYISTHTPHAGRDSCSLFRSRSLK